VDQQDTAENGEAEPDAVNEQDTSESERDTLESERDTLESERDTLESVEVVLEPAEQTKHSGEPEAHEHTTAHRENGGIGGIGAYQKAQHVDPPFVGLAHDSD
jgi:hypothetical protein